IRHDARKRSMSMNGSFSFASRGSCSVTELPFGRPIRLFAPAKVNLGLEVLGKRENGLHEVVTVMETISLFDAIDIAPAKALEIHCDADIPEESNLVRRAINAVVERTRLELPLRICLTK